jgi:hypothetical protein
MGTLGYPIIPLVIVISPPLAGTTPLRSPGADEALLMTVDTSPVGILCGKADRVQQNGTSQTLLVQFKVYPSPHLSHVMG